MGEMVLAVVVGSLIAYLGNQLAPVKEFPGKNWLIFRLFVWVTLIALAQQGLTSDEITKPWVPTVLWCVAGAAGMGLVFDGLKLVRAIRRLPKSQGNLEVAEAADDVRAKLLKEVLRQVRRRLKYAVGEQALINVAMQPDADAVDAVGSADDLAEQVFLLPQAKQQVESFRSGEFRAVPSETTILDTFEDEDIDGLLLILGAPGMGKTTALLKLAESLLARAEETGEIPYIFELSAWRDPKQEIADWLMAQLKFDYGIDEKVSRGWILSGKLVPLLDELPLAEQRGKTSQRLCVEKINEFVAARLGQQVVVCCRYKEYATVTDASGVKLDSLNGALQLQPLEEPQIQRYFEEMQCFEIWRALQDEAGLGTLMQSPEVEPNQEPEVAPMKIPLFVQMLAVAYTPEKKLTKKAELFDAYVERKLSLEVRKRDRLLLGRRKRDGTTKWAYESVKDELDQALTVRYLSWLARKLQKSSSTNNFLIEQMQPIWLETTAQKYQYHLICASVFGLIFGLMFSLVDSLPWGLVGGAMIGW